MRQGGSYIKEADGNVRLVERTEPALAVNPEAAPVAAGQSQEASAAVDTNEVDHESEE